MSALSTKQKAYLAKLARKAFGRAQAEACAEGAILPGGIYQNGFLNDFDEWRHEQVSRACCKQGLRCCDQDDYGAVKAHFLRMLGQTSQAERAAVRGAGNGRRVAEYKLVQQLKDGGFQQSYAEAICQNMFGHGVAAASEKEVWKVFYTVRNRALARRKKTTTEVRS